MRTISFSLFLALTITITGLTIAQNQAAAQDTAAKAQNLLAQARAALGGDKLKSLQSLSATGNYRRTLGAMEMSGEVTLDFLLPDKMLKAETLNLPGGLEITRLEALNGDKVWEDQQQHGGGGGMVMIRRGPTGGNPQEAQERLQQSVRAECARLMLGWLLATPTSFPVEFSHAGEAEAPDGKADVLTVKGPGNFALRFFLDQKTQRPLLLTYAGKKPRVITRTMSPGAPKEADLEKRLKDAEAEAAQQPDVEYQIRFSDYREVGGVFLPHRLSKAIDNEVNEEWEMTKFKLNPALKPEKFEKK